MRCFNSAKPWMLPRLPEAISTPSDMPPILLLGSSSIRSDDVQYAVDEARGFASNMIRRYLTSVARGVIDVVYRRHTPAANAYQHLRTWNRSGQSADLMAGCAARLLVANIAWGMGTSGAPWRASGGRGSTLGLEPTPASRCHYTLLDSTSVVSTNHFCSLSRFSSLLRLKVICRDWFVRAALRSPRNYGADQRKVNVAGTSAVQPKYQVASFSIVLIDDVVTTSIDTLRLCRSASQRRGVPPSKRRG